ncbi:MAG TPA: hypothetical protein VK196_14250 [Magnetospirillum sp.]|nr:hypothetical protein [Magnetospirillum sp.]
MTLRRLISAAAPLTALLALSACANLRTDGTPAPARPAASAAKPGPVVAVPPPPRPNGKSTAELQALRPSPRPTPDRDTAPPSGSPKLLGLSEDETLSLLGRPAEETPQPPGKIWIYRTNGCQLSVHLFPDMERGGFYALDYAAEGERDLCLGKIAGEARKKGGALAEQAQKSG